MVLTCFNHLEKYERQWEGWHPIYYGKKMFQSTNQHLINSTTVQLHSLDMWICLILRKGTQKICGLPSFPPLESWFWGIPVYPILRHVTFPMFHIAAFISNNIPLYPQDSWWISPIFHHFSTCSTSHMAFSGGLTDLQLGTSIMPMTPPLSPPIPVYLAVIWKWGIYQDIAMFITGRQKWENDD